MANALNWLETQVTIFNALSLLVLIFSLFVAKWFFFSTSTGSKNLPPSPPKLPIIGNLHQLGPHPHRTLSSLAQRHGPLMLLYFGTEPTAVVSSADLAREVLKTHDVIFANRPYSSIGRRLLYDYRDIAFAPYGQYWRQMRSICVLQLLSTKRVQSFRGVREEETALMIDKIQELYNSSALVDLKELFASLTSGVICRVALGRKYEEGKFKEVLEEFATLLGVFEVGNFIPWLGWVKYFNGLNARVERVFREIDDCLTVIIDDHRSRGIDGCGGRGEDRNDFVDVLLEIQKNGTTGGSMTTESIKALVLDMFAAGTDTIRAVLEWAMAELLRHPEAMREVQKEVREIVQNKPNITEDDLEEMHNLKAVIKETMRLHAPVPLLVQRECMEDVKVDGYDISAKTRVIINAWAIGRDPKLWEEAEEFRPERFLNNPIDFMGHDFELIPFGAGRRGCPGATFAITLIELALASLLHKFDWELPWDTSKEGLDVTESSGITTHLKFPLFCYAKPHYQ